jgi:hypothetical protein
MTNQKEEILAEGDARVRLPTESLPQPVGTRDGSGER